MKTAENIHRAVFELMFSAIGKRPRTTLEVGPELMELGASPIRARALPFPEGNFEFVFTKGLLVRMALRDLGKVFSEIVRVSDCYVGGIEKIGPENDAFWQDIGRLYQYHCPALELLAKGTLDVPNAEIGSCGWWVFRKPLQATGKKL